jgi:hypothetical protein
MLVSGPTSQLAVWERMLSRAGDALEALRTPGSSHSGWGQDDEEDDKEEEEAAEEGMQQQWERMTARLRQGKTVEKLLLDPWVQMMLGTDTLTGMLFRYV